MTTGSRARRLASALLLCTLAAPALADGEGGSAAAAAQPSGSPAAASRRPPPMVLVVPLGVGVLLPLTLPTTMPRVRATPAGEAKDAPAARAPADAPADPAEAP